MLSVIRSSLFFCLVAGSIFISRGQTVAPPAAAEPADDPWERLKQDENKSNVALQNGTVAVARSSDATAPAAGVISDYQARADEMKSYRTDHPGDDRASEARRLEALMLVYAGYYGDDSTRKRCDDLVAQVRADNALPPDVRFSLASLADYQPLRFQQFDSEASRLAQFEKTARALIAEFPDLPQAYGAFLCLAKDCPEDQSTRIASDLLKMNSPQGVKDGAQTILDRNALVGQSLKKLLAAAMAEKDMPKLAGTQITILYSWVTWNGGSILVAKDLGTRAPAGATILGVNLDTDTTAAGKVAADQGLPGIQIYDPAGPDSKLARQLKLTCDSIVFVTDRKGIITSVSARLNLSAAILSADK